MNSFSKTFGISCGAAFAAVLSIAAMSQGSQAAIKETGLCQSATVPGVISCCKRYIKTRDGMNWLNSGGSCNSGAAVCKGGGGKSPIGVTHLVAPKKICYLKKRHIKFNDTHDHAPPNMRGNNPNGPKP